MGSSYQGTCSTQPNSVWLPALHPPRRDEDGADNRDEDGADNREDADDEDDEDTEDDWKEKEDDWQQKDEEEEDELMMKTKVGSKIRRQRISDNADSNIQLN